MDPKPILLNAEVDFGNQIYWVSDYKCRTSKDLGARAVTLNVYVTSDIQCHQTPGISNYSSCCLSMNRNYCCCTSSVHTTLSTLFPIYCYHELYPVIQIRMLHLPLYLYLLRHIFCSHFHCGLSV